MNEDTLRAGSVEGVSTHPQAFFLFSSSSLSFFQAGHRLHCCLGAGPWKCPLAHSPLWQLLGGEVQILSLLGSPRVLQNLLLPYVATFLNTIFRGIPIGNRLKESWCCFEWELASQSLLLSPHCSCPWSTESSGSAQTLYKQQLVLLAITESAGLAGPSHKWWPKLSW